MQGGTGEIGGCGLDMPFLLMPVVSEHCVGSMYWGLGLLQAVVDGP